ncbi:protein PIN-LIKES 7-like [Tasmannia lanceolata]|uniref:protein PIN-LIKES 7-like n=1 Tax=Tasmannia lanceolata TaxID=3420 RepID=UPI0040644479
MGFWTLFEAASMPVLQVLIISILGAFLASGYCNLLTSDARKHMNKIVFIVFTPSLMFASLAKSVTLQDIISWWFMPINIGLTVFIGAALAWIAVKILRPEPHLEGLVIASCSAGNFGNLLLIVIPSVCNEGGTPFGDNTTCSANALSYASFSMALGGFYIWTYSYHLVKSSGILYHQMLLIEGKSPKAPNNDLDGGEETNLLKPDAEASQDHTTIVLTSSMKDLEDASINKAIVHRLSSGRLSTHKEPFLEKLKGILHMILEELMAPPTVAAILGFIFGAVTWLKSLIIGASAPLRVLQDSIALLGDGTIPCITLILGGNLTQGLRSGRLKTSMIIAIIIIRYVILPLIGIGVVRVAGELGLLSTDPLYQYVLMIQFTVPPAMNIGTMTQLFDVGQEECSVIFLWTYIVAALALTIWSTVFMWILT